MSPAVTVAWLLASEVTATSVGLDAATSADAKKRGKDTVMEEMDEKLLVAVGNGSDAGTARRTAGDDAVTGRRNIGGDKGPAATSRQRRTKDDTRRGETRRTVDDDRRPAATAEQHLSQYYSIPIITLSV